MLLRFVQNNYEYIHTHLVYILLLLFDMLIEALQFAREKNPNNIYMYRSQL